MQFFTDCGLPQRKLMLLMRVYFDQRRCSACHYENDFKIVVVRRVKTLLKDERQLMTFVCSVCLPRRV